MHALHSPPPRCLSCGASETFESKIFASETLRIVKRLSLVASFLLSAVCLSFPSASFGDEEEQEYPVHQAVRTGENEEAKRLLSFSNGKEVGQPDEYGMTPMHYATSTGNLEMASVLLNRYRGNANVQPSEEGHWVLRGRTPLHLAVAAGNSDLVKLLLEYQGDVFAGDKNGILPIHLAVQYGSVKIVNILMREMGEYTHRVDRNGTTPLHLAAQHGRGVIAVQLLARKGAPNKQNRYGLTPLHYAALNGHADVVELLLLEGAKVNTRNKLGITPLYLASRDGNEDVVKLLLNDAKADTEVGDEEAHTPLCVAVVNNHFGILKKLLGAGANPTAKDKLGMAPLHFAARQGHEDAARTLLEQIGANVDIRDNKGNTPLHYATKSGQATLAAFLIKRGADTALANADRKTPFDLAREAGNEEILSILR